MTKKEWIKPILTKIDISQTNGPKGVSNNENSNMFKNAAS